MCPKVSVIIPIYGVESYIERCARSLFNQTLEDIEYIFVDDCSPDKSVNILRNVLSKYPQRNKQTKIVRTPINSGLPAARQYGLQYASGDFIIHCDSDDWVDDHMYESMYKVAIEGGYDVVVCDFIITNDADYEQEVKNKIPNNKHDLIKDILLGNVHGALWNKLFRRRLYNEQISFPKDNMLEDLTLVVQLLHNSVHIAHLPQSYYRYFYNINSISKKDTSAAVVNRFYQSINNYELIRDFFVKEGCVAKYKQELSASYIYIKYQLVTIIDTPIGKTLWNSASDVGINNIIFLRIPLYFKIRYILIELGIYTLLKKIKLWVTNSRN